MSSGTAAQAARIRSGFNGRLEQPTLLRSMRAPFKAALKLSSDWAMQGTVIGLDIGLPTLIGRVSSRYDRSHHG